MLFCATGIRSKCTLKLMKMVMIMLRNIWRIICCYMRGSVWCGRFRMGKVCLPLILLLRASRSADCVSCKKCDWLVDVSLQVDFDIMAWPWPAADDFWNVRSLWFALPAANMDWSWITVASCQQNNWEWRSQQNHCYCRHLCGQTLTRKIVITVVTTTTKEC